MTSPVAFIWVPKVRLAVVNAVSVLTGLSSDKISVVKWKS